MKTLLSAVFGLLLVTGCQSQSTPENTGVIIIDAQEAYVMASAEFWPKVYAPDMPIPPQNPDPLQQQQIANISAIAASASEAGFPMMLTFEASDQGSSRLIEQVAAQLPADTPRFIKQYFDITSETHIRAALQAWQTQGITDVMVVGAETDVCVLQSVLGLKTMGFNVHLNQEAVFSTERYRAPALARMESAGINLMDQSQMLSALASEVFFNNAQTRINTDLDRNQMATLVLGGSNPQHHNLEAAQIRLQAWLTMSEYQYKPIFAMPTLQIGASFWQVPTQFTELSDLDAVINTLKQQHKTQLVVAGIADIAELSQMQQQLAAADITMFVLEDAWFGRSAPVLPLNQSVPWLRTTAKISFYEIIRAVFYADVDEAYVQNMEQKVLPSGYLPPMFIELFPYILKP